MSKQKIKDAILEATGKPSSGWVAENADYLAQKIAEALAETPKPVAPVAPAVVPTTSKTN